MDISKLVIQPHLKNPWSAIDLGFVLTRTWYVQLLAAWCICSVPLFLVLLLVLPADYLWLSAPIIWWFKPLWDRGPLFVASRALFQQPLTRKDFIRQLPALYKRQCISWLTWRRLHMARSFVMPVTVLERLTGKSYNTRVQLLQRMASGKQTWLTIVAVHIESFLVFGMMALVYVLIPEEVGIDYWQWLEQQTLISGYVTSILSFIAMALVGPFYVVAGFMLYINRRIQLEGWDIEIQFRLMAENAQAKTVSGLANTSVDENASTSKASSARNVGSLASIVLLLSLMAPSDPVLAQPDAELASNPSQQGTIESLPQGPVTSAEAATARIQALADPEPEMEWQKRFRLRKDIDDDAETEDEEFWLFKWLRESLADWFGDSVDLDTPDVTGFSLADYLKGGVTVVLLLLAAVAFYYAHQWYLHYFPKGAQGRTVARNKPVTLFGLDVTQDNLPDDVVRYARELMANGDTRQAMALVYRSTLSQLIHTYHFDFADGNTEKECAGIVLASDIEQHQPLKPFMQRLTASWLKLAYAHKPIAEVDMSQLFDHYEALFDA
ncbi:Uncharacterised protein [BD1-7 clade bacterium]|uniref:DUF4129 domain-containing protein n=1 Tax=BD1-7 clade bacterium TaxID=2029982 RepID=A0A5S9Q1A1_9GAMM|nr:Uncharacterised protein [BD1-7 clade bacterium]CAA0112188.1 Uncharacterised protein [BD1-7 clade bacterium]